MPGHVRAVVVAFSLVALTGCPPSADFRPKSSGSLGLTSDDRLLIVADADHDRVTVLATEDMRVIGHVAVGRAPERILVAPDDSVYVSNRGDRTVMRIDTATLSVVATGAVGAEPVGMTVTADGRLLVANSASGTVSILDAQTLAAGGQIEVGGTPWAVTALPDGVRAYVTDMVQAGVMVVDLEGRTAYRNVQLDHPEVVECQWGQSPQREPSQPADVVLSPDGDRAYVAHVLSRTGNDGLGNQTLSLAVAPSVSTVETSGDRLMIGSPDTIGVGVPQPMLVSTDDDTCLGAGEGMDAPSSLVVDATGDWIYVADHNSETVAIVSARGDRSLGFADPERGIADLVRVGARPTGLAVRGDLSAAYVHNAFDYDIAVVQRDGGRLSVIQNVRFAESDLDPAVTRGRRLFYSAADDRMTEPQLGGVSCSSCHPNARTDSLSWSMPVAFDRWDPAQATGPRNTPALWGIGDTAPYQWDGQIEDLPAYSHMMVSWMGGRGLTEADVRDLVAYMKTVEEPDNLFRETAQGTTLEAGEAVFTAQCASCHGGSALTNGQSQRLTSGLMVDTPSLRGVFATAPYLHDGSARTLREAIQRTDLPGHGGVISATELDALEAYVRTF